METITLWINNRLDKETSRTFEAVKDGFFTSRFYSTYNDDMGYYSIREALLAYLTDTEGLNAAFEQDEFEKLYDYIRGEI